MEVKNGIPITGNLCSSCAPYYVKDLINNAKKEFSKFKE